jgi:transposase
MAEGGLEAVRADDDVVAASRVRELDAKVRELERLLGRKTMETEILRDGARAGGVFHAGTQPREQRGLRGIREDPEARLRPR